MAIPDPDSNPIKSGIITFLIRSPNVLSGSKRSEFVQYLWRIVRRGLDPEDDLVLEGVGVLVAGEEHVGVLEQLTSEIGGRSVTNDNLKTIFAVKIMDNLQS